MKKKEGMQETGDGSLSYRDTVSNVTKDGKRKWVFAAQPSGKLYRLRGYFSVFYFLSFFSVPFIRVNGMPFFMLNFPEGKFIVFSKVFWPQDFFIFAVGMIMAIIFIALFTVIYGRIFCGWICPQTIFMEMMFRKVEWWIEGSALQQQKLAKAPWNTRKIILKSCKHMAFLLLSFLIANTFLAYIIGVEGLRRIIIEPVNEHLVLLAGLLLFTFLFYAVFAFIKDIVCTTICPYGRLQSVLSDRDTMQVAYDYKRGETRGKISFPLRTGDCIDCNKCVQVCPTGIDIRNGVQMECVGCTACIDACNTVMDKIGKPKGLIRYASENQIKEGAGFHFNRRMRAYSVLLILLSGFMIFLIASANPIDTNISRVKGQLYQELPQQQLSNLYNAKILNKTKRGTRIELRLENITGEIKIISTHQSVLKKEAVNELTFFIVINRELIRKRNTKLVIGVYENGRKIQTVSSTFLGPFI